MIAPLENRFPAPPADLPPPYGIIVLGGAIDDDISRARGQTTFDEGAERLTEAAILARRYPSARIVYTGGSNSLLGRPSSEAEDARRLLVAMGVDPQRITLETRSRNTDENARFTAAIVHPEPDQTWLIVTSAYHMPRAMGLFRKAGFAAIAYPVDYRTEGGRGRLALERQSAARPGAVRPRRARMGRPARLSPHRPHRLAGFPARERSLDPRRAETVDAAEVVGIGGLALAKDDEPAGLGEPDGGGAHARQMAAPGERVLAARGGVGLGGVGRVDRSAGARLGAEREDDVFEAWRIGVGGGAGHRRPHAAGAGRGQAPPAAPLTARGGAPQEQAA